jgi:cytochrome P450
MAVLLPAFGLVFVATILVILWLRRRLAANDPEWARSIPKPKGGNFVFGHLAWLAQGPLIVTTWWSDFGSIFRLNTGLLGYGPMVVVTDPAAAKIVLRSERKGPLYDAFREKGEDNIFVGEGEFWRTQRRICNPAFSHSSIRAVHNAMTDEAANLCEKINANLSEWVDADDLFGRFALDVIGRTAFGQNFGALNDEMPELLAAVRNSLSETTRRDASVFRKYFSRESRRIVDNAKDTVRGAAREAIERRRAQKDWESTTHDLLTMLLTSTDPETGQRMPDRQILIELGIFIAAGHDTTAHTLAWTVYHVLCNPSVLEKLRQELDQVMGERQFPSANDVRELKYLDAVIKESMRLSPVAPLGSIRQMEEDVMLCGHSVPKGAIVWVPFIPIFHDPKLWEDPLTFNPQRFLDNTNYDHQFFPFSKGPRNCIGQTLAKQELFIGLATIFKNYEIEFNTNSKVVPHYAITMQPRGLFIKFKPREVAKSN